MNGEFTKMVKDDELRPEYKREELGVGVRGKYFDEYNKGTNLVLLSPDVAKAFPTEEAVNQALRSLIEIAQRSTAQSKPANLEANQA
jgi:hypothetical protein